MFTDRRSVCQDELVNRRVEQGNATRAVLVDVATDLFATGGYDDTSIPAVLAAAGVSRGALYHHFASKEALFEAVLESVEIRVAARVARAVGDISEPFEALRKGCSAYIGMCREPAIRQISLIDAPAVLGWERWREIDARHAFGMLKASVAALAAAGRLQGDLIDSVAHMLLASLMEIALMVARAGEGRLAVRRGQTAFDDLLNALFLAR